MGIYEHVGNDGLNIRLKELITNKEFPCRCTSGYVAERASCGTSESCRLWTPNWANSGSR